VSACAAKGVVPPVTTELDEVVISDSKLLSKEKSGKVIVKITAEDLKKRPINQ
jgi:vitamin B12 transporter